MIAVLSLFNSSIKVASINTINENWHTMARFHAEAIPLKVMYMLKLIMTSETIIAR